MRRVPGGQIAVRGWMVGRCFAGVALLLAGAAVPLVGSEPVDARIRLLVYAADEVYRLKGYVGYQIDLEFEPGEAFVGLGTGDVDSLTFAAQDNHLFLKPRTRGADTNLTVLTTRRTYHFDYSSSERRPDPAFDDVVYVLRFIYPPQSAGPAATAIEHELATGTETRPHNFSYGYQGTPQLKPLAVWDDGVQTHLSFDPHEELPAIFLRNDDGSESLLNFTVDAGNLIVHRVAREFTLRRGALQGCVLNQNYSGSGQRLDSGTVAPAVERTTRPLRP